MAVVDSWEPTTADFAEKTIDNKHDNKHVPISILYMWHMLTAQGCVGSATESREIIRIPEIPKSK